VSIPDQTLSFAPELQNLEGRGEEIFSRNLSILSPSNSGVRFHLPSLSPISSPPLPFPLPKFFWSTLLSSRINGETFCGQT
jgi:hypothetical protein